MPAKTLSIADTISNALPRIFEQAQNTTANHQKNRVALHKLHKDAAAHVESVQNGKSMKLVGERAFEDAFIDMVNRVLQVKKGVPLADRVVKFIGGYVRFMNEKAAEEKGDGDEDEDTTASRFVARLLKHLAKGFLAKDKNVRYRVLQIVAEMISHLGEIDDDIYTLLRASLLDRINDKESFVRIQAVIALSKLSGTEDPEDLEEGEPDVVEVLIDILQFDTAAEVRRAALLNIPATQRTFPAILSRTRDTDDVIRKMVYSHVLHQLHHPKQLTIAQRELIVRNGLGDRQAPVRAAAGKLIATWVDVMGGEMIEFLKTFDLVGSEVAEDALLSVFVTRPDIFDNAGFDEAFWNELTPEKAFLVRIFVEHCISTKDESRLESSLPVVTALAFKIQSAYNDLLEQIQVYEEAKIQGEFTEEEQEANEDARADQEFVIAEMLKLAVNLDYADEIGRRKMFGLVRDMISQDCLPENLVAKCLDVLRVLSPNERDLIRVVVEVVHELRDHGDSEKEEEMIEAEEGTQAGDTPRPNRVVARSAAREMTHEENARAALIDLRCLNLCIGMLERVNGTFEDNSTLEGILGELILPNVRAKEMALREKGLVSLGLCCLIARRMALNSFQLFINQVQSAPEFLKIRVLKIVFDILMVHEGEFLGRPGDAGERIVEFLLHVLENEESDEVQAVACVGIGKLMLSGMVSDERVLKSLVLAYVSPYTKDNQELRQCLSYFFPVYCYSSPVNQRRLQKIALETYSTLSGIYSDLDDELKMIPPSQIALLLADWTDPRNAVEMSGQAVDDTIHVDLAIDIVKTLLKSKVDKDDKKILSQTLGKLYFPDEVDEDKIRTLKLLVNTLQQRRPAKDATTKNAIIKFDNAVTKRFAAQLEGFNEDDFRKLEDLKELFEFLDEVMSSDEEDDNDMPPPPKKRNNRSQSASTNVISDDEDFEATTPPAKGKAKIRKGKAKTVSPPAAPRTLPRRAAKSRPSVIVESDSESGSGASEPGSVTPSPPVKRKARSSKEQPVSKRKRDETDVDNGINALPEPEDHDDTPQPEESDGSDEGEVDDLLASDDED
ncbi:nuclear condensing complex subunit [Hysterangium stoloniferum]|nr:nuclear condensing complex subunit [Hysterangium stoloniferum]